MPVGQTPQIQSVIDLSTLVFGIAAVIFVGVEALLLFSIWRFRERPGHVAATTETNRTIEVAWTLTPLLTLVVVFVLTVLTMRSIAAAPPDLTVQVTGHRWFWEFRYGDVVTDSELHLPVGQTVRFDVTSADVIHSFWMPDLSGKRDAVPGQTQSFVVTTTRVANYDGACAEFCGVEHAWMRFKVIVQPQDEFQAWLDAQRTPAAAAADAEGERLFMSSTCVSCHTVRGTPANGTAGPDLTHLVSRATIGSGIARNDDATLARWVKNADVIKPGVLMPQFQFTDDQVAAIVRYLRGLK